MDCTLCSVMPVYTKHESQTTLFNQRTHVYAHTRTHAHAHAVGSGWLTAPFALAECGVILGSLLIIFFALAANQTKNYLIESIARIEAIEKVATGEVEGPEADVEKSGGGGGGGGVAANEGGEDYLLLPKPTYEIGTRRWEMTNCARKTMGLTGSVVFNIVCKCYAVVCGLVR